MATTSSMNKNNAAVKRIMQEAKELANDPSTEYTAAPLEEDIFEWHCTIRGPAGTEYEGGLYHIRILLPAEYPFRPPSLMVLTPNGRFELNTKICISFTNYHEELWQPAWGVRTAILGLQGFFPLRGQAAVGVGSIEYPAAERKRLAALSRDWICPHCQQSNAELLPDPSSSSTSELLVSPESGTSEPIVAAPHTENSTTPTYSEETPVEVPPSRDVEDNEAPSSHPDSLLSTSAAPPVLIEDSTSTIANSPTSATITTTTVNSAAPNTTTAPAHSIAIPNVPKPPLLLDVLICAILVLVLALILRRIF